MVVTTFRIGLLLFPLFYSYYDDSVSMAGFTLKGFSIVLKSRFVA
jgi:hypothetical protein